MDIRLSKTITTARIWAIFSIVSAHISFSEGTFATKLFSKTGSIGVILFIIISGYLFNPEKFEKLSDLLKNKSVSIGIPWLFFGTVTYLYNALLSRSFSIVGYFKWIIGNGTFLYYLTVLMILFLVFYYLRGNMVCIAAILINIVSLILTSFGFLNDVISVLHITNYLNVFNWAGYFAIGCLLRNVHSKIIFDFLKKFRFVFILIFTLAFCLVFVFDFAVSYFSKIGGVYLLLAAIAVFSVSTFQLADIKLLKHFSNSTFAIYLFHMIVIGLIDTILAKSVFTQILAPVIIAIICFVILSFGEFIAHKLRLGKFYSAISGIRNRK